MEKKQMPVGFEFFDEIIEKDLYYVDKTNLINELFENNNNFGSFIQSCPK